MNRNCWYSVPFRSWNLEAGLVHLVEVVSDAIVGMATAPADGLEGEDALLGALHRLDHVAGEQVITIKANTSFE